MKKTTTTIIAALSLLIGAGGVVVWKQRDTDKPQSPVKTTTSNTTPKSRTSNPTDSKPSPSQKIKWSSITDSTLSQQTRINLAKQINANLSQDEIDLLFDSLRHQPAPQNKEQWWVVMNEIIEQMRRKGVAPERLGGELISIVEDTHQSEIARDYAVQHLSIWVAPPNANSFSEPSPETSAKALTTIAATIIDPSIAHTSIPGTALMALTAASPNLPPETMASIWATLDPAMTSMLKGETQVPLSTRTTIIQAVAMRGSSAHLPLVQSIARDHSINPSMRLSSIAALGIYSSEDDRAYLTSIATGKTRYRYAAQAALKKLRSAEHQLGE